MTNPKHLTKAVSFAAIAIAFLLAAGCSPSSTSLKDLASTIEDGNGSAGTPDTGEQTPTEPSNPTEPSAPSVPDNSYKIEALSWETSTNPERRQWSEYLHKIILDDWNTLLGGADDMSKFCPRYNSLDNDQRANVWAALFSAMAKYESAYSPTSRMHETTMGTDPVTGNPVYSEGLLQLSYQDVQWARWCEFDWSKDKNLAAKDPRKTILDPYKNLYCGVGIMAKQIKNKGLITVGSGAYWAVLKSGGKYQKITEISGMVKKLSFCK
ncbi:hypothetical protein [Bdellovibrio bacteriovorus]|uniref:hypothetical protein n=1 Tax=Bdellovibrio bacteriovorus TaxID=959 RepID=UPI003D0486A2